MHLSIVIPVYNRPEEINDLLFSLREQSIDNFEVIIVEDGSTIPATSVVDQHRSYIEHIQYISIPNGGPSRARNVGAKHASGEYIIILDSDVVLPKQYLSEVVRGIGITGCDAFGGPDAAAPNFDDMQKAVNYAMTSRLTTGGIRGGRASGMETFKPRSFNMGCRRDVFMALGGFSEDMRYGEDIDFSLRLIEYGARVCLLPEAYVYHKRRVSLSSFFWQVYHSGEARIELERRHPGSTRPVHYLPAFFTLFVVLSVLSVVGSGFLLLYALSIALDSLLRGNSLGVSLLAIVTSYTQLIGYGSGFISAMFRNDNKNNRP